MRKKTIYSAGQHPNSLANLVHTGRPKAYNAKKKVRSLTVTEEGWDGSKAVIKKLGYKSVSEFLENLGRGQVNVSA